MTGQQPHEQPYSTQQQQQHHPHHNVQPPLPQQQLPPPPPTQQHHMPNAQAYHQHLASVTGPVVSSTAASTGQPVFDLGKFWLEQMQAADAFNSDFKNHPLPLARIKKVMKTDQDVKMISAEAPILFAKGCEIFITELTKRAWVHAEENKRRTLQRSDIATAVSKTDMCDFLIDIVPRDEASKTTTNAPGSHTMYDQNAAAYAAQHNPNNAAAAAAAAAAAYYQQPSQYANPSTEPQAYYQSLSQLTNDPVQQQYQMLIAQQQQQQLKYDQPQQPQQQQQIKYDQPKYEQSDYDTTQQQIKYDNDAKPKPESLN
ncbi:histone-fold-containing protein [Mycotypha africana]|uniref:histone-fold-containing protein n=1 Tax=Mycotypha africana TaxID=64632 RepID=UPI0022FFE578|nr:histone-fold-containing protein [Mycotypha africana]KAI8968181.1 histone-fold-containing protein [Mycotypha africana]